MQLIHTLYTNILEGEKYIDELQINKYETNTINHQLFKNNTYHFPTEIKEYIKLHMRHKIIYNTKINGKNIQVNLYTKTKYSNTKSNDIIYKILLIIYVLNLYASNACSKNLIIDIYFTPLKRLLPKTQDDILEPININGGVSTSGCNNTGEITIYREEDWYKVLIHELFHNLNLDFSTMNINKQREILKQQLGINSKYKIYETYCETWARILNVMIVCFLKKTNNYTNFLSNFKDSMFKEINFSIIQSNKIMKRITASNNNYRENTNALCYYVFTAALLYNYKEFLHWCNNHNHNIIKFKQTKKNVDEFCYLILNNFNNPDFLKAMQLSNKIKLGKYKNSLSMTII